MAQLSDDHAQFATIAMGTMNVIMTVISLVLVEKAGRKTLLLVGFVGMFFDTFLLAICLNYAVSEFNLLFFNYFLTIFFYSERGIVDLILQHRAGHLLRDHVCHRSWLHSLVPCVRAVQPVGQASSHVCGRLRQLDGKLCCWSRLPSPTGKSLKQNKN
jgi:MFS family permease